MSGRLTRQRRDVERLVTWALLENGLGWVGKERSRLDFSDYGTVIDDGFTGSHPTIGRLTHDDAMIVKLVIDKLPRDAQVLVTQYGRTGLRPDWCEEGKGRWEQLKDGRGRLRWKWANPESRSGAREPLVGFVGLDPELVDLHRAEYAVWWQGLADIVAPLNNQLQEHFAVGPEAPREPWSLPKPTVFGPDGQALPDAPRPHRERAETAAQTRARAADTVNARATDWGFPERSVPMTQKGD